MMRANGLSCELIREEMGMVFGEEEGMAALAALGTFSPNEAEAVVSSVRANDPVALAYALSCGADPEGTYKGFGRSPLATAAQQGYADCLCELIKAGANVNQKRETGMTSLMAANDTECIELLIEAGATLNASDDCGSTALFYAVFAKNEKKIRMLIKAGANLNIIGSNEQTALMHAAKIGDLNGVEALLDYGALINTVDPAGRSALIHAVRFGRYEVVRCLVAAGADVKIKDEKGVSARQLALQQNHPKIAEVLLSAEEVSELREALDGPTVGGVRARL